MSKRGHAMVLWRPIQHIYPLEVDFEPLNNKPPNSNLENQMDRVDPDVRDKGETSV